METLNDMYAKENDRHFKETPNYNTLLSGTGFDTGYAHLAPTVVEVRNIIRGMGTDPQKFYDLRDRLSLVDPHTINEFTTRRNSVSKINFTIKSHNGKNSDQKLIDIATEDFRPIMKKAKKLNQEAILMGIKPAEINWVQRKGRMVIQGFRPLRKDHFFWINGKLNYSPHPGYITQAEELSDEDKMKLYAPTYFHIEPEKDFEFYGGLFKYAAMISAMKFYTLWNAVKGSARYGKPLRIGKYDDYANTTDIQKLENAIYDLGEDLGAVFPESMKIELAEFKGLGQSNQVAETIMHRFDGYITKLYNGQTLATTAEKYGTRAQSDFQKTVRDDYFEDDLEHNEDHFNELLKKWWWINISRTSDCPLFIENDYKESEDLVKLSTVVGNLKNAGAGHRIPAKWINEKFDIPEPEENEETLRDTNPMV